VGDGSKSYGHAASQNTRAAPAALFQTRSFAARESGEADRGADPAVALENALRLGHSFGAGAVLSPIQPHLEIGAIDDHHEREADRLAAAVMNRIASVPSREWNVKNTGPAFDSTTPMPGGSPLADAARMPMEQAFGADLRAVRLHNDTRSDTLSRAIGARAFTVGRDVYFQRGEFDTQTARGQQVLAHELTHVIQQHGCEVSGVSCNVSAARAGLIQRFPTAESLREEFRKKRYLGLRGKVNPALERVLRDLTAYEGYTKSVEGEADDELLEEGKRIYLQRLMESSRSYIAKRPRGKKTPRVRQIYWEASDELESLKNPGEPTAKKTANDIILPMDEESAELSKPSFIETTLPSVNAPNQPETAVEERGFLVEFDPGFGWAIRPEASDPDDAIPLTGTQLDQLRNSSITRAELWAELKFEESGELAEEEVPLELPVKIRAPGKPPQKASVSARSPSEILKAARIQEMSGYYYYEGFASVDRKEVDRLISGNLSVEEFLAKREIKSARPQPESMTEEIEFLEPAIPASKLPTTPEKKPKDLASKAARYAQRGADVSKKPIRAGVQYTRAYWLHAAAINPSAKSDPEAYEQLVRRGVPVNPPLVDSQLADYAYRAALAFEQGGDVERAVYWYRRVLVSGPQSKYAQAASEFLQKEKRPEQAPYQSSRPQQRYTSVSQKAELLSNADEYTRGQAKKSGLAQEEVYSPLAKSDFETQAKRFYDASLLTDPNEAEKHRQAAREAIDRMATGINTELLLKEFGPYYEWEKKVQSGNLSSLAPDTPNIDRLEEFKVKHLTTAEERAKYKLEYEGSKDKIQQGPPPWTGAGFDTAQMSTNFAGKGFAIFTMSPDGDIYAATHRVSQFHHSSFLAESAAAGAGELKADQGQLKAVTNKSGHYAQGAFYLQQVLHRFQTYFHQALAHVKLTFFGPDGKSVPEWPGGAEGFLDDYQKAPQSFLASTLEDIKARFKDKFGS
jgi:hypothetical protein